MEAANLLRILVNSVTIDSHINEKVTVIGYVAGSNPNGTNFEIRASDDNSITVQLREPLNEPIFGLVEVIGTSKGNKTLLADEVIRHMADNNFDIGSLNQAIMIINEIRISRSHDQESLFV